MKTEESAPPVAKAVLEGNPNEPVQPTKPASTEPAKVTDQAPTPRAPSPEPVKPKSSGRWTFFHEEE